MRGTLDPDSRISRVVPWTVNSANPCDKGYWNLEILFNLFLDSRTKFPAFSAGIFEILSDPFWNLKVLAFSAVIGVPKRGIVTAENEGELGP
jgi:hypothetical protein